MQPFYFFISFPPVFLFRRLIHLFIGLSFFLPYCTSLCLVCLVTYCSSIWLLFLLFNSLPPFARSVPLTSMLSSLLHSSVYHSPPFSLCLSLLHVPLSFFISGLLLHIPPLPLSRHNFLCISLFFNVLL